MYSLVWFAVIFFGLLLDVGLLLCVDCFDCGLSVRFDLIGMILTGDLVVCYLFDLLEVGGLTNFCVGELFVVAYFDLLYICGLLLGCCDFVCYCATFVGCLFICGFDVLRCCWFVLLLLFYWFAL